MVTDKRAENIIRNTDAVHEDCEHMLLNKEVIRQVKKGPLDHVLEQEVKDRMRRNFVGKNLTENTLKRTSLARGEGKTSWKAMEVMWKWSVFLCVTV